MRKLNKFITEDYEGIFDRIKVSKNKIESVLKTHGYNSPAEFLKEVDKINGYSEILQTGMRSNDVTVENILSVYEYKQEYEDLFSVIDELNSLLLEIRDEGLSVNMTFRKKYTPPNTGY